jgi:PAS domain S-box-containing protein
MVRDLPDGVRSQGGVELGALMGPVAISLTNGFKTTLRLTEDAEKSRAEQVRHLSEVGLRDLLDGIGEAFYALDRDHRILYVSRRALEIWGKTNEDLIGRPFLEAFPHAEGTPAYQAHGCGLETGLAEHFEIISPLLHRWFEVDIYPSSIGLLVVFRDIEQRKRAEQKLRQDEERLQTAVDLLGLGLYSWNPQTNGLDWDARLKAMWGTTTAPK